MENEDIVSVSESYYQGLDNRFQVSNSDRKNATYKALVNFTDSLTFPRHRWYYYREGFSPELVGSLLTEFGIRERDLICDPFCGAGTTLAVAQTRGIRSIGFEVNPFSSFISHVKTRNYSSDTHARLSEAFGFIIRHQLSVEAPGNDYIKRMFEGNILDALLMIKANILNIDDREVRELLLFAWLSILEDVSNYRKAGNGLKRKRATASATDATSFIAAKMADIIDKIAADLASAPFVGPEPVLIEESAMDMGDHVEDGSVDAVIFSPPYANCFDYTKIYYAELWMGDFVRSRQDQQHIRMQSVRSHVHATWPPRHEDFSLPELQDVILPAIRQQKLWTTRIPDMINGYFADMNIALRRIFSSLRSGGNCAIVVSNSAYGNIIVPTDTLLAMIAQTIGFTVNQIDINRLIITSSQQFHKTESMRRYLRESIIKLSKP